MNSLFPTSWIKVSLFVCWCQRMFTRHLCTSIWYWD